MSFGETTPAVSLEVFPKQLSLAGGERQQVLAVAIVASNPVRNLRLLARPGPGSAATVGKPPTAGPDFRGDLTWPVSIFKADDGRSSAEVVLEARYETGEISAPVRGTAFATVTVTLKARPKIGEVVTGAIETAFDKLEERRPQIVYLTIDNIGNVPVTIRRVLASGPPFVTFEDPDDRLEGAVKDGWTEFDVRAGRAIIPPRQQYSRRFELQIPANTPVQAGKYLLFLRADVEYVLDGYKTTGTVLMKREFQAGVLGQDEFVGITSVPFLVLPGFLFITAIGLLVSRVWPRWNITLDYKKPEYYFLSVLSALGGVFLYGRISPWIYRVLWHVTSPPRDAFSGYSFSDIVNVWVFSLAAAVIPWMTLGAIWSVFSRLRALILRRTTPTPGDTPLDILEKLGRARKSFDLRQVVSDLPLWELPLTCPDPAMKWVSGRIKIVSRDASDDLRGELEGKLGRPGDPEGLRSILAANAKFFNAQWESGISPRLVDRKSAPAKEGESESFIQVR